MLPAMNRMKQIWILAACVGMAVLAQAENPGRESVAAGDKEAAGKNLDLAQSVIDKAVVKGVMHRNTASRRKKLISRHVKSLVEA